MKLLNSIACLLLLSTCPAKGQQNVATGINIRPNAAGTAGGYVDIYTAAGIVSARLQSQAVSSNPRLTTTTGDVILEFCDGTLGGGWEVGRLLLRGKSTTCTGTTNIDFNTDGTIRTSLGIGFYESGGLTGDTISIRAPSGGVTSPYTINLPGTGPSVAGQSLSWVSGSTYAWTQHMTDPMTMTGDMIYASGGVPVRLGIGSAGQCLTSGAGTAPSWGTCNSDPAWTSYTPTVSSSSGSPTTNTLSAAYIQTGKSVKIRIAWNGTISSSSTGMLFSYPVAPTSAVNQLIPSAYADASGLLPSYALAVNGLGIAVSSTANFPSATNFSIILQAVYEAN